MPATCPDPDPDSGSGAGAALVNSSREKYAKPEVGGVNVNVNPDTGARAPSFVHSRFQIPDSRS